MITLITGTPGSGKSYEAVAHHILPALRSGRKVLTNLPFNVQHFKKFHPAFDLNLIEVVHASSGNLVPFSKVEDFDTSWHDDKGVGPLIVIDEAHMAFPRGDKDKAILEWFTLHRHTGADVLLITQQLNQMRREIGGLVEVSFVLKKNGILGSSGSYRRQVRDGTKGAVISTSVHSYDKKIFPFYQSYTLGGSAEAVAKVKPIWFRWPFLAAAVMFVYVGYSALSGGLNPFGGAEKIAEAAKQQKEIKRVVVAPPPDVAPAPVLALPAADAPAVSPEDAIAAVKGETVEAPTDAEIAVERLKFDLRLVKDITAVRLGAKCRVFLHVGDRQVEMWELVQRGYEVRVVANEGADKEAHGSCSMYVRDLDAEKAAAKAREIAEKEGKPDEVEEPREFAFHMSR